MNETGKSRAALLAEVRALRGRLAQHEAARGSSGDRGTILQAHGLFGEVADRFVDAIILIDGATEKIVYANAAAHRVLGYEASALEGAPCSILLPPACMSGRERLEQLKVHDAVFTQEVLLADGTRCTMDMTVTIVRRHTADFVVLTLREITERVVAEQERERLVRDLQEALANVRTLSGLLPICAACKRVRDDQGYWNQIEAYIRDHSEVDFSHGICPDCAKRLYPDYIDPRKDDETAP